MKKRFLSRFRDNAYNIPADVSFLVTEIDINHTEYQYFLHYKNRWYSDFITVTDRITTPLEAEIINILVEQIDDVRKEVDKNV